MKQITYTPDAQKTLQRMPRNDALKIRAKVEQYAADPKSLSNNVKKLQGGANYRLRVGDWRVIFSETMEVIGILKIGPRGSVYE